MKDYAVYRGDQFLCVGTIKECAEYMGVQPDTVRFYASKKYHKRVQKEKNPQNFTMAFPLEDEK